MLLRSERGCILPPCTHHCPLTVTAAVQSPGLPAKVDLVASQHPALGRSHIRKGGKVAPSEERWEGRAWLEKVGRSRPVKKGGKVAPSEKRWEGRA